MKLFRIDDLRALAGHSQWPSVSLYVSMHRSGRDTRENPIRLRNAVAVAKERLVKAGYPREDAGKMLEPAADLIASRDFWLHQSDGLVVFAAPGIFQYYRVPLKLHDDVVVADHFAVKQLIPLFTEDGRFYVLAMSQNQIRFFEATHSGMWERTVPEMPKNMEEFTRFDQVEVHIEGRTMDMASTRSSTTILLHGQGNIADKTRYKADVRRYVHEISRKIERLLDGETAPLILAAVEYEQAFYRQENAYHHLLDEGIHGNPDSLNEDQIHQAAWEIVEPHFAEARKTSLRHFGDLSNTDKTSDRLEEILPAAVNGRVRALYLRTDVPVWGEFDTDTLAVEVHETRHDGDMDLLSLAVVQVLQHKGIAYALHQEDMPTDKPQAAMFRYG